MSIEPASEERSTPYTSAILVGVLAVTSVFGYGGPLGFVVPVALGGLLLAPVAARFRWPPVEWLILALLVAWAATTMLWSPAAPDRDVASYADLEALTALKLALQLALYGLLVVGASKASTEGARRALWAMVALMVPWSVLLLADGISGGRAWVAITSLFGVETPRHLWEKKAGEGAYVLAVLAWPAIGFLLTRRRPALAVTILVAGTLGMAALSAWSGVAAVFAGLAAMLLVGALGVVGGRVIGIGAAALTVAAPMLVATAESGGLFAAVRDNLTASWAARTRIWSFAAERITEQPFRGWGLDASRTFGEAIPLHTHDAPLQLWLELGLPGVLLACAFWIVLGRRISRLTDARPAAGQFAAATAVAYFTVGALSFGVWQEWWLAVGALAFTACALAAKVRPSGATTLSDIEFRAAPNALSRQTLPEDLEAV